MEGLTLILKATVAVAGVGSVIAVPTVLSLNAPPSPIVLNTFQTTNKEKYQDKCQVLLKDIHLHKYLLVCGHEDGESPSFYFYGNKGEPIGVKSFKKVGDKKIEFEWADDSQGISRPTSERMKPFSNEWTNIVEVQLGQHCEFNGIREKGYPWKIQCPKDNNSVSIKKDILLTPLVIK